MANVNRIILIGRLTADPEVRSTMDGQAMAKFRLSVGRPQGGADLIEIIAWGRQAEAARDHFKKGKLALAEGRIQIRSFDDQAGQRRWATEVVASRVQLLDAAPAGQPVPGDDLPMTNEEPEVVDDDAELAGELPF